MCILSNQQGCITWICELSRGFPIGKIQEWWLSSGYVQIAIKMAIEIVRFPKMVIFHSYVNVYQRVNGGSS